MKAFIVKTMIGENVYAEDFLVVARTAMEASGKAVQASIKRNGGVKTSMGKTWRVTAVLEQPQTPVV